MDDDEEKKQKEKEEASEILDEDSAIEDKESEEKTDEDGFEKEDELEPPSEEGLSWKKEEQEEDEDLDDLADQPIPHVSTMNEHSQMPPAYSYPSLNRTPNQRGGKKLHLLVLVLIGIFVVAGTVYLLKNNFSSPAPSPTPIPQIATPTPLPTPTPINKADFKISILNGTSKTGLASTTSSKLKDLGYQITKTGNATNSAFERTIVRVKPNLLHLAEALLKDLMPDFDGLSDPTLESSGSDDAVVILGTK